MRINNTFATADTTYAGLNMNLRSGAHHFEIQFHTPDSLRIKQKTHRLYEKLRRIARPEAMPPHNGQNTPASERESLEHGLRSAAATVRRPEGIEAIGSIDRYEG